MKRSLHVCQDMAYEQASALSWCSAGTIGRAANALTAVRTDARVGHGFKVIMVAAMVRWSVERIVREIGWCSDRLRTANDGGSGRLAARRNFACGLRPRISRATHTRLQLLRTGRRRIMVTRLRCASTVRILRSTVLGTAPIYHYIYIIYVVEGLLSSHRLVLSATYTQNIIRSACVYR